MSYQNKENEQATTWYRRAAESGNTTAMTRLGVMLGSTDEAMQWYRRAAQAGDTEAMSQLGWLSFSTNWGVTEAW
jgi:TPR repeat protein